MVTNHLDLHKLVFKTYNNKTKLKLNSLENFNITMI